MHIQIFGIYCEITSSCNYSCVHCYNNSGVADRELPFDLLQRLILEMADLEIPSIMLSGGEPLLHPNFRDIIALLVEKRIRIDLITNGSLLYKYQDALQAVDHVQISLDGASSHTHDRIRGKGTFENVVKQISGLSPFILSKVTLKMVLTAYNKHEVLDYIDLAKSLKVKSVTFGWLNDLGRAKGKKDLLISNVDKLNIIKLINQQRALSSDIEIIPIGTTDICPYVTADGTKPARMSLRIDSKGDIYPCQQISCDRFVLGNIYETQLNQLSDGPSVNSFFEYTTTRQKYIKECQKCVWNCVCKGGCIGDNMSDQCLYLPDSQCYLRKISFRENVMKRIKK